MKVHMHSIRKTITATDIVYVRDDDDEVQRVVKLTVQDGVLAVKEFVEESKLFPSMRGVATVSTTVTVLPNSTYHEGEPSPRLRLLLTTVYEMVETEPKIPLVMEL